MKKPLIFGLLSLSLCGCKEEPSTTPAPVSLPRLTPPKPMAKAPVSFTDNVATVLGARCANCHIEDSKGGFNTATFNALMKGGESGPVVVAGKPDESKLVKLIEAGEMPPRGGPLSDELKTDIREWVEKGAKFDGPAEDAKLMDYIILPEDAEADSRGGRGGGGPRGGDRNNWDPVTRFDKNKDGKLTKDEVEGRLKDRFDEIDADKDGTITSKEFDARMKGRSGRSPREGTRPAEDDRPKRPAFDQP